MKLTTPVWSAAGYLLAAGIVAGAALCIRWEAVWTAVV